MKHHTTPGAIAKVGLISIFTVLSLTGGHVVADGSRALLRSGSGNNARGENGDIAVNTRMYITPNHVDSNHLDKERRRLQLGSVTSFTLVDSNTGVDITTLSNGDVVDVSDHGTAFTIRANVEGVLESVVFSFDGRDEFYTDNEVPYTITGSNTAIMPRLALNGVHTLSAWAKSRNNGGGQSSATLDITFTISGSTLDACLLDAPTSVPSPATTDVPAYAASPLGTLNGELRTWHKVTLGFRGPLTCERAAPNPFTDLRLDVEFSHVGTGTVYTVPGYYAADGNAANTGANSGDVWLVHFAPSESGTWAWSASFKEGANVAQEGGGTTAGHFDGASGSFNVLDTDKGGRDHRGKGILNYVGEHHLRFAGTGEWFLKAGADSPENFLAYEDFDGTTNWRRYRKSWSPHIQDYNTNDPTWAGGRGKGMIGAVNYLSEQNMNVFSFLPMNIAGDDRNVFPYVSGFDSPGDDRVRIDVSKTAQWEVVFEHADKMGMYLHFKTQEQENDQLLDGGELGLERKLYYRELIARFAHHHALNWNIGEETSNTFQQQKDFAEYFQNNDPYKHHIVIHTNKPKKQDYYPALLGLPAYTGASLQSEFATVFSDTLEWRTRSAAAGHKWVVAVDESGGAGEGVLPDTEDPDHDIVRKDVLWANIMAGGGGVEYYFGYKYPHSDVTLQDYRSRANMWVQSSHALTFFSDFDVPFWTMSNSDNLVSGENWCLADSELKVLVVYLRNGGSATIDTRSGPSGATYSVEWYNPRSGGSLIDGSVTSIAAGVEDGMIGAAPYDTDKDWVVLVKSLVSVPDSEPDTPPPETSAPIAAPTLNPIASPTSSPVDEPTKSPISEPTESPMSSPTSSPIDEPTNSPTSEPTRGPISGQGGAGGVDNPPFGVTELTLCKSSQGKELISPIIDGSVFDLSYVGRKITVCAETFGTIGKSVEFNVDNGALVKNDNVSPFALNRPQGIFLAPGLHTVTATMYSEKNGAKGSGVSSSPLTISFTITDYGFAIIGFMLVDAATDEEIRTIKDGDVIDLDEVGTSLNVRALKKGPIGSVKFEQLDFSTMTSSFRTENVSPYALGGDFPKGNYKVVKALQNVGKHTITAIPYSGNGGGGTEGVSATITITITGGGNSDGVADDISVDGFVLVNAASDEDIGPFEDGDVINLGEVGNLLNIYALTTGSIGSVIFERVYQPTMTSTSRTENVAPYALGGDFPVGDYHIVEGLKDVGMHTITATPYPENDGLGVEGVSATITITVA